MIFSFTLTEDFARQGSFTWRLKDSEIRYRGTGAYSQLIRQRISVNQKSMEVFVDALNLLDVWAWRDNYHSEDTGWMTMDGSAWTFSVVTDDRQVKCAGINGYPAFRDPLHTTTERERFALLVAAMYECFNLDIYLQALKT